MRHVANILNKLGLRSRAQVAVWAVQRGLGSEQQGRPAGDAQGPPARAYTVLPTRPGSTYTAKMHWFWRWPRHTRLLVWSDFSKEKMDVTLTYRPAHPATPRRGGDGRAAAAAALPVTGWPRPSAARA